MPDFWTTGELARELGVPRWRLLYWLERHDLPEPSVSIPGRRLFTADDVRRIKELLAIKDGAEEQPNADTPEPPVESKEADDAD